MKTTILNNLKNIAGWKTNRKIVTFSVDDYGNVRLASKQARQNLDKKGFISKNRFDLLDSLENKEDLEMLFEVLTSVRDVNSNHAIFTPFAIPVNINYEKMADCNYQEYHYELLTDTFSKLNNYKGTWELWREGIEKKIFLPQFHGREHFNLKVFKEKLSEKNQELLTSLKNKSNISISRTGYKTISYTGAFEFSEFSENDSFHSIIEEGVSAFKKVFGYQPTHFMAPGGNEHSNLHKTLHKENIKYIDSPLIKKEHQGNGKFKRTINYLGKRNKWNQILVVRNAIFEPTYDIGIDWVHYTLQQIEAAFRWNKPVIISSHRVNFSGFVEPQNRKKGLQSLKLLLKKIVNKWPEVEFMASNQVCDLISQNDK